MSGDRTVVPKGTDGIEGFGLGIAKDGSCVDGFGVGITKHITKI
jgi:hypothetical protein